MQVIECEIRCEFVNVFLKDKPDATVYNWPVVLIDIIVTNGFPPSCVGMCMI